MHWSGERRQSLFHPGPTLWPEYKVLDFDSLRKRILYVLYNIYKIYYLKINRVPRYCTEETMGTGGRGSGHHAHRSLSHHRCSASSSYLAQLSTRCLLYAHLRSWVFNLSISAAVTVRGVRKNTQCSPCVHGFKEIAKGQERPRSPSWGRAQPRGRWTELPCPSGVRQAFTEVPLLYLTFFFWDWAADHGAKMIKLSGKAFVCLSLERQLPTHNNDLMVKKKKERKEKA